MSRLTPQQILIGNLKQSIPEIRREYQPREEAYRRLKEETGQDFGYDAEQWEQWFRENAPKSTTTYIHQGTKAYYERLVKFLQGKLPQSTSGYLTTNQAYFVLKKRTGQDFGYDAEKWKSWLKDNGEL